MPAQVYKNDDDVDDENDESDDDDYIVGAAQTHQIISHRIQSQGTSLCLKLIAAMLLIYKDLSMMVLVY